MISALAGGELVIRRRWVSWKAGIAVGNPDEVEVRLLFAPESDGSDAAGRRGLPIARFSVFGERDVDLAPHDLVVRADGAVLEVVTIPQRWTSPWSQLPVGCHAQVSAWVDSGPETILIYPSVVTNDSYGTLLRSASSFPVTVSNVSVEPVQVPESSERGQDAPELYRLVGRGLSNLDAFSAVEWVGRRFEVVGSPLVWPWPPSNAYTQATLREVSA